jgi:hypothetical protein
MVREGEQVGAEPVAARLREVLDVATVDERRERARDGARVDAGQPGELGRAGVSAGRPVGGIPRIIAEPAMPGSR